MTNPLDQIREEVVGKYTSEFRMPMLIIGANSWLKNNLPEFSIVHYNTFLFFYPNHFDAWVVGSLTMSRELLSATPHWRYAAALDVKTALRDVVFGVPFKEETPEKMNEWLRQWIARCPRISFRDVANLPPYEKAPIAPERTAPTTEPVMRLLRR